MWLKSRGSFILTDCIVRNHGAVVEPWREYRTEGNSYFVFQLLVMLGAMAAVVVLAIVFVLLGFLASGYRQPSGVVIAALLIPFFICWFAFCIVTTLIFLFMAPVMYRQRCTTPDAARQVLRLIFAKSHAIHFVLSFRNRAGSGDACYRMHCNVFHLLYRRDSLCGHRDSAAGLCCVSFILAFVSAPVRSRLRCMGELYAAGIFACANATGFAFRQ